MESTGLKRALSTLFGTAINFVYATVPGLPGLPTVTAANGVLGLTGLAHSSASKTLFENKTATVGAALTVLYAVATHVPVLMPYAPVIAALINVFGGAVIAKSVIPEKASDK